jgi:hypothetical protein
MGPIRHGNTLWRQNTPPKAKMQMRGWMLLAEHWLREANDVFHATMHCGGIDSLVLVL